MIGDELLAMCELGEDLLYGRIPQGKQSYYVKESLRLGREAAARVKKSCGSRPMEDLCREAGIRITYLEESGKRCGVSFRAQSEYGRDGSGEIVLYRGSIALLAEASGVHPELVISRDIALETHLAHEYFHYLEFASSGEISPPRTELYGCGYVSDYLDPVELPGLFRRKRKAGILRCSEIAAHAFAKEYVGLPILPNYYDYAYLIREGKWTEAEFQEMLKRYGEVLA
ncbi:hypothetical protein B5E84_00935 [Lachnoclostridium sp. An14]|mgnify:FL=1|uniref:hypothetical protein n=1 Tax=Lachnoclostridium sp. An14 TaxID=1965562 RepID=UPI000B393E20|nr:hypothetical protein [Lachnoclostridium sp. An14]OUQ21858.1 hypothetical protein B5E84_00935 [Lachnoclostridium sp. An14]